MHKCWRCDHTEEHSALRTVDVDAALTPVDGIIYWHIDEKYVTSDMDKYKILFAFQQAFSVWQKHFCPLVFVPTKDKKKAPIVIRFMKNGDRGLPAKFGKDTLAYAYYPSKGSLGIHSDMYFNDAVHWADMHKPQFISLFKVAVHELGHAFGLDHSKIKTDIMYPTYQPNNNIVITDDTRDAITRLYDKKRTAAAPKQLSGGLLGWIEDSMISRIIGIFVRRGMDIAVGVLLASSFPVFVELGRWITENGVELETALASLILLAVSAGWSYLQKRKDSLRIKELMEK